MHSKLAAAIILVILCFSLLSSLNLTLAQIQTQNTIYIRADGSVEGTDKIQRVEDIYTFTADLEQSIVVERDNLVLDGANHTLQSTSRVIYLENRNNVTIENLEIKAEIAFIPFPVPVRTFGITLIQCSNITISRNIITSPYNSPSGSHSGICIHVESSSNITISKNTLTSTENNIGLSLKTSSGNTVANNKFVDCGINIEQSFKNDVTNNTLNDVPIVYVEDKSDLIITDEAAQVILVNCSNIKVKNLVLPHANIQLLDTKNTEITNNKADIHLKNSSRNNISENTGVIKLDNSNQNTLIGNNWQITLLNSSYNMLSSNKGGISTSHCINVTIIENNLNQGLDLQNSHYFSISGNNITGNQDGDGIFLHTGSSFNTINNNTIVDNQKSGLRIESDRNNITENVIENNKGHGIYLEASNNFLRGNELNKNNANFGLGWEIGWDASMFINNVDASNLAEGKPIIYWINKHDRQVPENAAFVALINCSNITAQNLNLSKVGQGIVAVSTKNLSITQNSIQASDQAVLLHTSAKSTIDNVTINGGKTGIHLISSGNIITDNVTINGSSTGIHLVSSSKNSITNNLILTGRVGRGIRIEFSSQNTIKNNIFNAMDTIAYSGITMYHSNEAIIRGNIISGFLHGIGLDGAKHNIICFNEISNCDQLALTFWNNASGNLFYLNNFIDNAKNVEEWYPDESGFPVNLWDHQKVGNFWSDYPTRYPEAEELNGTGIWNTPYILAENNQDNYPLMEPVDIESPYEHKKYALTVNVSGKGFTDPAPGTHLYEWGMEATIEAIANEGWKFEEWTGDVKSGKQKITLLMDGDKTVIAHFAQIEPVDPVEPEKFTLTIHVKGEGTTDPPPGIYSFEKGKNVAVEATPDGDWTFDGWTGDLTCEGEVIFVVMDGDQTVTANFVPEPLDSDPSDPKPQNNVVRNIVIIAIGIAAATTIALLLKALKTKTKK